MSRHWKADTLQGLFDLAYNGVLQQGVLAMLPDTKNCSYTIALEGKTCHCAIGHCLTEEGLRAVKLGDAGTIYSAIYTENVIDAHEAVPGAELMELQRCHDAALSLLQFKARMVSFAKLHNLQVP